MAAKSYPILTSALRFIFCIALAVWTLSICCGLATHFATTVECVAIALTAWFPGIVILRSIFLAFMSREERLRLDRPEKLGRYLLEKTPIMTIMTVVESFIYFYFMGRVPAIACCVFLGIMFTTPAYQVLQTKE